MAFPDWISLLKIPFVLQKERLILHLVFVADDIPGHWRGNTSTLYFTSEISSAPATLGATSIASLSLTS